MLDIVVEGARLAMLEDKVPARHPARAAVQRMSGKRPARERGFMAGHGYLVGNETTGPGVG